MIKNEIRFIYRPEIVNINNQSVGGGTGIGGGVGIGSGGGQQSFMDYGNGWSGNTTYLYDVPSSTVDGGVNQVLGISGWTFDTIEESNSGWMRSDLGSTEPIWMDLIPITDPDFDSGYYTITVDIRGLQSGTTESITPVIYGSTGLPISSNGRFSQSIYVTGTTQITNQQIVIIPTAGFTGGFSNISLIPSMGTTKRLDLYDEDTFTLNFQISSSLDTRSSNYSKTIKVPGSQNNNEIFKMLFDENVYIGTTTGDTVIFLNKRIPAGIYQDTIQIMVGYFELEKVVKGEYFIEYEGTFYGNTKGLADTIGDKKLYGNDNPLDNLDFSEYDHIYNIPNVLANYNNTTMYNTSTGYYYPFIDFQGFETGNKLDFTCVRPAFYVKQIWDKIFSDAGYSYTSTFLNSAEFKSLIIPLTKSVGEDTFEFDKSKFQIGTMVNCSGDTYTGEEYGSYSHSSGSPGWNYWSGDNMAGYHGGVYPAVKPPCNNTKSIFYKCGLRDFVSYSDGRNRSKKIPFEISSGCLSDTSGNTISFFNNSGDTGLAWDTTNRQWTVKRSGSYKLHAFITYDLYGKPWTSNNDNFVGAWTSGDEFGQYNSVEISLQAYKRTPAGLNENIGETVEEVYINNPHVGNFGDPNPNAFARIPGTKGEDWILTNQYISLDISEQDLFIGDVVYFYMNIKAGADKFKWRSVGTPMIGGYVQTWVMINKTLSYCNNDYNNKPFLYEGNQVHMNKLLPDMKQIDFIKGISNMYNLMYQEDKDQPGNIVIEPWSTFFSTGITDAVDWTYKVDGKGEETIDRIPDLVNKDVLFLYTKDTNDDLGKKYTEEYNTAYGSYTITNPYLSEGSMKIETTMSSAFVKKFGNTTWLMSSMWNESKRNQWITDGKRSDQTFPTKIMYRKKLLPTDLSGVTLGEISLMSYLSGGTSGTTGGVAYYSLGAWKFGNGTVRNYFPYAGHVDNPYNPTKDCLFGVQKYYYNPYHRYTTFNLFKNYWKDRIALYLDPNSKLVTYTMRLNHTDIATLSFRRKVRIGNTYYYINKINDWTNGQTCKVDLIRYAYYNLPYTIDTPTWKIFQSTGCQPSGGSLGGGSIGGGGGTGIGGGNPLLLNLGGNSITNMEISSNQTGDLDVGTSIVNDNSYGLNARGLIIGKNNNILSNNVLIMGDNNTISQDNVSIIGSKNNTIAQQNIVIIGSDNNTLSGSEELIDEGLLISGLTSGYTLGTYSGTTVLINSHNNTITDSRIVMMNSSDNVINSGVTDVVLISTTGQTVSENYKTYIGGKDLSTVVDITYVTQVSGQTLIDSQSYTDLKSGETYLLATGDTITYVDSNFYDKSTADSTFSSKGGTSLITIKTSQTLNSSNQYLIADNYNGTGRTITLMTADKVNGKIFLVHDLYGNANSNNISIGAQGDGLPITTITTANGIKFIYTDGSTWYSN